MQVNINIEEDAEFRKHVKELITGQVRAILRAEMNGIVAAEIAKIRLLDPKSPQLGELVSQQVDKAITTAVSRANVDRMVRDAAKSTVSQEIGRITDQIRMTVREELRRIADIGGR